MSLKLVHLANEVLPELIDSVITIGAFDGLHRGHMLIIKRLVDRAKELNTKSILISFDPHPKQILDPQSTKIKMLTTLDERVLRLESTDLDYLVIVPFTFNFAQLSSHEYLQEFIISKFNPKVIISGEDHKFGKNGQGDNKLLKEYAKQGYFEFEEIASALIHANRISSSQIREYILNNKIQEANQLLHYHYSFTGKVIKGIQIGKSIGYPTANLEIKDKDKLIPNPGIYSARMKYMDTYYNCMLYIGIRPTLGENLLQTIELHILNFNEDLYGQTVEVALVEFIRKDEKFASMEAMKSQIKLDELIISKSLRKDGLLYPELVSKQIAIVILNYNGKKFLREYLPTVLQHRPKNSTVYVIDNFSKDDSTKFLEKTYPEVKLIKLRNNYGYAGGYNKGLAQIKAAYYVLINSDIKMTMDWISPIVEKMKNDPRVFAAQGKILSLIKEEEFEYAGAAGGLIDILAYPFCKGRIINHVEKDEGQYNNEDEIFWCSGAAMVVNSRVFDELRGFDADFFAHQEEIDLCWRMKRLGGKIMYYPQSKVYHLGGGTLDYDNPKKTYLNFRNNLFTLFKNTPWFALPFVLAARLFIDVFVALSFLLKGQVIHFSKVIQAYIVAIINTLYLIHKKSIIDEQIDDLRFAPARKTGVLNGFILLQYYLFQNDTVSKIPPSYFSKK